MAHILRIHENDNVAVVLDALAKGDSTGNPATGNALTAKDDIPFGHKIALRDIEAGEDIVKYGEVIGRATRHIAAGSHVHVHNVESKRGRGDLA